MKAMPGKFALYLTMAVGLLSACAGCYDPKADIDAFRPEAEKYFAKLEKVGKAVASQPPVTQDTMSFPDSKQLRFEDGPTGKQNTEVINIDELSDFGPIHFVDHVIDTNGYHLPAWALLHGKEDPHVGKVTKEVVPWRFQQLLDIKYLVVLRTKKVYGEVTNDNEFKGGEAHGDAFLCEVNDAATLHGGFAFAVQSSSEISFTTHGDAAQQASDRRSAVFKDLDEQGEKFIHHKIRTSLPEAQMWKYW